jgi:hypothetical protein
MTMMFIDVESHELETRGSPGEFYYKKSTPITPIIE